jgi:large subunit ribosomal protein L10
MLKSEKPKKVESLTKMINEHSVIGILNVHKMPTKQMQQIKVKLRGQAKIQMGKNIILTKALENSDKDLSSLVERVEGETAILLTNENPFKLYATLKENRIPSAAKVNDISPDDITIPKGPTNQPPGPAITTLQKAGLKTTVQEGKVAISEDTVVAKKGDIITGDMVNAFNMIKLEPMKVGVSVSAAWEDGIVYSTEVLDVDKEEYITNLETSAAAALNLAVNAGYPTKESIGLMISKAFNEVKTLVIDANIIEKDFIDELVAKAAREAKALEVEAPIEVKEDAPKEEKTEEESKPEESNDKQEEGEKEK